MNGIVTCSITSEDTGIFAFLNIYLAKSDASAPKPYWKRLFGHLFDKCELSGVAYHNTGHWTNGGNRLSIVGEITGFAMPYLPVSPVILPDYREMLTIAELFDVPEDFLDRVKPPNVINGEGKLILTGENLLWSMWYGG
ncbi:MAG TPA: hypothetical protein VNB22_12475 [Pyrinomonadaceae bacterium]|jgi:hypothetical protein|nr:hypothetical protein [Pyrinomonadaceae bacterium]